LDLLPYSESREALRNLTMKMMNRSK
jgi:hypothetical protein